MLSSRYYPRTNQWTQIAKPMNQYDDLRGCLAVSDRNTILLFGGKDSEELCTLVEKYNTETDLWAPSGIKLPFAILQRDSFVCRLAK